MRVFVIFSILFPLVPFLFKIGGDDYFKNNTPSAMAWIIMCCWISIFIEIIIRVLVWMGGS